MAHWFRNLKQGRKFSLLWLRAELITNKDKIDKNKLFNNPHTYNAILAFLDATEIGLRVNNNEIKEEEAVKDCQENLSWLCAMMHEMHHSVLLAQWSAEVRHTLTEAYNQDSWDLESLNSSISSIESS
jgi:hypothetical protein